MYQDNIETINFIVIKTTDFVIVIIVNFCILHKNKCGTRQAYYFFLLSSVVISIFIALV